MKTIIFLHGWFSNCNALNCIKPLCDELNYNFYSFDLPFHGKQNEVISNIKIDLNYFCNYAINKIIQFKDQDIILVGHSFGGLLALILSQFLDNAKKVILINPLTPVILENHELWNHLKNIKIKDFLSKKNLDLIKSKKNENHLNKITKSLIVLRNIIKNDLVYSYHNIEINKNINYFLIQGENDFLINPKDNQKELSRKIKNLQTFNIKDAKHSPHLNFEKEFIHYFKLILNN